MRWGEEISICVPVWVVKVFIQHHLMAKISLVSLTISTSGKPTNQMAIFSRLGS